MKWTRDKLEARVRKVKSKYGANIYREWGLMGGNPILIKQGRRNRAKNR